MPDCEALLCVHRPSTPLTLSLSKGRPFPHATSPFGLDTPCATLDLHPAPPLPRRDRLQPVSRYTRSTLPTPYPDQGAASPAARPCSRTM